MAYEFVSSTSVLPLKLYKHIYWFLHFFSFRLCWFCVVIWFLHPLYNGQWPPTSVYFYPRFYPQLFYCPILILVNEPVFLYSMLSSKQGNYLYHFYNVFGMTRPWLGIEPRMSRTQSQHSTTRLSRRWYISR